MKHYPEGIYYTLKGMIAFGYMIHGFIGALSSLFAVKVCGITEGDIVNQMVGLCILGSLLPDIDHPNSLLGRFNPLVCFFSHRGMMHSIIGTFFIALPLTVINFPFFIALWVGALSHCIADGEVKWL